MPKGRETQLGRVDESIILAVFVLCVALIGVANAYGVVGVGVVVGLLILPGLVNRYLEATSASRAKRRRCEHGHRGGAEGGCQSCIAQRQSQFEAYTREREQETERIRREVEAEDFNNAEAERISSTMRQSLEGLLALSPSEFEDFVAGLFRADGYEVKQTPYAQDGGMDAMAVKGGRKYLIECKRFRADQRIGRPVVQRLRGAMHGEGADSGFLVTTSSFSRPAEEYAAQNEIVLLDGEALVQLVRRVQRPPGDSRRVSVKCGGCGRVANVSCDFDGKLDCCCGREYPLDELRGRISPSRGIEGGPKKCPRCGKTLRVRSGRRGRFYGCSGYPSCRHTEAYVSKRAVM